ncbi:hypothetical protein ACFLWS_02195 [Chloroflexota bacterium]
MATSQNRTGKKPRITEEDVTKMKRLFSEGKTIVEIAKEIPCHRLTVRKHLDEVHTDPIADEVKKQILGEELRSHYRQLVEFTGGELKSRMDASVPEHMSSNEPRGQRPISTEGMLGIPYPGQAKYMCEEWLRMYHPPPKYRHLLKALRQHTRDSSMWAPWDRWRKEVADYEKAGRAFWDWLEERNIEQELRERVDLMEVESSRKWLFGNILRVTGGNEPSSSDSLRPKTTAGEGIQVVGADIYKEKSGDTKSGMNAHFTSLVVEARRMPAWEALELATAELNTPESQLELKRIAGQIEFALAGIELMNAFPGRCELCPV